MKLLIIKFVRKISRFLGYRLDFTPLIINDHRNNKAIYIERLSRSVSDLDGDIVECGLGNGVTFERLGQVAKESSKKLFGFDSFQGFPKPSDEDVSSWVINEGDWSHANISNIESRVKKSVPKDFFDTHIHIIPGFFKDTFKNETAIKNISFLHLDVDLYSSYIDCLNHFFDRVVKGGVIAIDEYLNGIEYAKYPGGYISISEFFKDKKVDVCRDIDTGKYYLRKL